MNELLLGFTVAFGWMLAASWQASVLAVIVLVSGPSFRGCKSSGSPIIPMLPCAASRMRLPVLIELFDALVIEPMTLMRVSPLVSMVPSATLPRDAR